MFKPTNIITSSKTNHSNDFQEEIECDWDHEMVSPVYTALKHYKYTK